MCVRLINICALSLPSFFRSPLLFPFFSSACSKSNGPTFVANLRQVVCRACPRRDHGLSSRCCPLPRSKSAGRYQKINTAGAFKFQRRFGGELITSITLRSPGRPRCPTVFRGFPGESTDCAGNLNFQSVRGFRRLRTAVGKLLNACSVL